MTSDQTSDSTDSEDTRECEHCGEEFPAGSGVNGSGSILTDGVRELADGNSVSARELFAFDEAYCSMACSVAEGDGGE